jgi:thioredoxin 1
VSNTTNSNQIEVQIVEIGEANFFSEVVQSKVPVLVGFLAPWSQPFQVLRPVLDEVVTACAGRVKVAWVNADDNPNLSRWYRIKSTPTLLYFVGGRPRARVVGTASKEGILSQLKPFTETAWRQEDNL